ncbi:GNAT family N-acetyltransferase [Embleya sp. NPDC001921]
MHGTDVDHDHPRFRFRRVARADFSLLASWLSEPHVARWWNHETSPDAVARDFGDAADGLEPSEDLLALRDGTPVGLVQRSRLADYPDYLEEFEELIPVPAEAVTIDYLIGDPDLVGRGLGTAMIRALVTDTWVACPQAPSIVVAVAAGNAASWRVLERVGFLRVGEGPMEPDNPIDPPLHYLYRLDRPT